MPFCFFRKNISFYNEDIMTMPKPAKVILTCLAAAVGGSLIASIATHTACRCGNKIGENFRKKKVTRKSSSKKGSSN